MSQTSGDSKASASVLLNGLRVLEAFSQLQPVLGVTEIAREVGLHKSSVSRILSTLEQAGYVERDEESGRFRLGLGLLALAGPLLADLDVRRVAHSALERLTRRTTETSALMVWNAPDSIVVEQVPSPRQVKHTAAIGSRYATAESASVQVFVAELSPGEVERLLDGQLRDAPRDSPSRQEYVAQLKQVRTQGYAVNDGRTSAEEVGVAAPVRDHRGDVVAAVLLSAPRFRVTRDILSELTRDVSEAAAEISARLGHPTDAPA
ncbi:MAG TPA: IclR family transcriptional regulator [Segeticoccus sp.]|uniref:IclR family transcriptional regulator n=1 Tax=Segeticoccus sp. TaxID=2706531 RepID=UPI002D80EC2C|nr:IclR family transcriptional regulator [Segeticoccus sp.]HET8601693.1 IclR family transcriptional regulator [Segeticoccus sp.]